MGNDRSFRLNKLRKRDIVALALVLVLIVLPIGMCFRPSGLSNCVVVSQEADFTGSWLKYSKADIHGVMRTSECERMDMEKDNGDGPEKGKTRWATCLSGPDCHEEGMY